MLPGFSVTCTDPVAGAASFIGVRRSQTVGHFNDRASELTLTLVYKVPSSSFRCLREKQTQSEAILISYRRFRPVVSVSLVKN